MDSPLISTAYDGKRRKVFPKKCSSCPNIFYVPKHRLDSTFCSMECCARSKSQKQEVECGHCGTRFLVQPKRLRNSASGRLFCKRKCKDEAQSMGGSFPQSHLKTGFHNYRERALRFHGAVCKSCGYDKHERMLDADHIDGNRENSSPSNLQVLCVWCHALKTRRVPQHGPVAQ